MYLNSRVKGCSIKMGRHLFYDIYQNSTRIEEYFLGQSRLVCNFLAMYRHAVYYE